MAIGQVIDFASSSDDRSRPGKGSCTVDGTATRLEKRQGFSNRPAHVVPRLHSPGQMLPQTKTIGVHHSSIQMSSNANEQSHGGEVRNQMASKSSASVQPRDAPSAAEKSLEQAKTMIPSRSVIRTLEKAAFDKSSLVNDSRPGNLYAERGLGYTPTLNGLSSHGRPGEIDTHKLIGLKRMREEGPPAPSIIAKKRRLGDQPYLSKPSAGTPAHKFSEQQLPTSQRVKLSLIDKKVIDLTGSDEISEPIVIDDDDEVQMAVDNALQHFVATINDDKDLEAPDRSENPNGIAIPKLIASVKAPQSIGSSTYKNDGIELKAAQPLATPGTSKLCKSQTKSSGEAPHKLFKQVMQPKRNEAVVPSKFVPSSSTTANEKSLDTPVSLPRKSSEPKDYDDNGASNDHGWSSRSNLPLISSSLTFVRDGSPSNVTARVGLITQAKTDPTSISADGASKHEAMQRVRSVQITSGSTSIAFHDMGARQLSPSLRNQVDGSVCNHDLTYSCEPKSGGKLRRPQDLLQRSATCKTYGLLIDDRATPLQLQHATRRPTVGVAAEPVYGDNSLADTPKPSFHKKPKADASPDGLPTLSMSEELPVMAAARANIGQVFRGDPRTKCSPDMICGTISSTAQEAAGFVLNKSGVQEYGSSEWQHSTSKLGIVLEQNDKNEEQSSCPVEPDTAIDTPQIPETPSPLHQSRSRGVPNGGFTVDPIEAGITSNVYDHLDDIPQVNLTGEKVLSREVNSTMSATEVPASNRVERVLGRHLEELSNDSEYWTRALIKRARCSKQRPVSANCTTPFSFSALEAIQTNTTTASRLGGRAVGFAADCLATKKRLQLTAPITPYKVKDTMPAFSHYVDIKRNFLALNQKTMISWPYFGDDYNEIIRKNGQDPEKEIAEVYSLDIGDRPEKLLRLIQAQRYDPYVKDVLNDLGISWADLLRFLLDLWPDVGTSDEARKALSEREAYCIGDFSRKASRTAIVLSSIPESDPNKLAIAALLFENFQKMTGISLWHVARRHMYDQVPSQSPDHDTRTQQDRSACRVCLRFQCPYHGEIQEIDDNDDIATDDAAPDVAVKDIINPKVINSRERVEFGSQTTDSQLPDVIDNTLFKTRQSLPSLVQRNLVHELNELGPFYPCHHPGKSCEDAHCTCFESRIMCEKTCSCSNDCTRKFQGCSCSSERKKKGQKMVCFEDERCACLKMSRECDPDLCGACGVADVLDPLRRYDSEVLVGRCHNASVQRGVTKHTLVGKSLIAGLGLFTTEPIEQHEFVGEYKGEIISHDEAERRWTVYQHQGLHYIFSLNAAQEIDGTYYGNKTRFVNHARQGKFNLYPKTRLVNSVHRIALYAVRRIRPGEELFFDYGPMFPDELVGGKSDKKKTAPRAANLKDYYDVEQTEDEHGTLRARKVTVTGHKSKSKPNSRANNVKSVRIGDTVREPAIPNLLLEDIDDEEVELGAMNHASDTEAVSLPQHRLYSYNISDEDDQDIALDIPEPEEDDDFEPEVDASDDEDDDDGDKGESGDEGPLEAQRRGVGRGYEVKRRSQTSSISPRKRAR